MLRTKYSEEIEKQMKAYFDTLNAVLHQLDREII